MKKINDAINQVFNSLTDKQGKKLPLPRIIGEERCEGCGNKVIIQEMPILGGENKGTLSRFKIGCKCEDKTISEHVLAENERFAKERVYRLFEKYSLINADLQGATLENFDLLDPNLENAMDQLINYVKTFDVNKPRNIIIHGNTGVGKSHLAVATTKFLLNKGYHVIFINVPRLLTIVKDTYSKKKTDNGLTTVQLLETMREVDLLVLDDIGAENDSAHDLSFIFEVLDDRAGKHTMFTTNLNAAGFRAAFGQRNTSRVLANGMDIKMYGNDYRALSSNITSW